MGRRGRRRELVFLCEDEEYIDRIRERMGIGTLTEVLRFSLRVTDLTIVLADRVAVESAERRALGKVLELSRRDR